MCIFPINTHYSTRVITKPPSESFIRARRYRTPYKISFILGQSFRMAFKTAYKELMALLKFCNLTMSSPIFRFRLNAFARFSSANYGLFRNAFKIAFKELVALLNFCNSTMSSPIFHFRLNAFVRVDSVWLFVCLFVHTTLGLLRPPTFLGRARCHVLLFPV